MTSIFEPMITMLAQPRHGDAAARRRPPDRFGRRHGRRPGAGRRAVRMAGVPDACRGLPVRGACRGRSCRSPASTSCSQSRSTLRMRDLGSAADTERTPGAEARPHWRHGSVAGQPNRTRRTRRGAPERDGAISALPDGPLSLELEDVGFAFGDTTVLRGGVASPPPPGRSWRWSARPARASPPWSTCWPTWTSPPAARSVLGGVDTANCDADELRAAVVVAFQESFLFARLGDRQRLARTRGRRSADPLRGTAAVPGRRASSRDLPHGRRHGGRRARRDALGRATPAGGARPGARRRPAAGGARRRHLGGRPRGRVADPRDPARRGHHDAGGRPPSVDHHAGGPGRAPRRRPRALGRHARRAARATPSTSPSSPPTRTTSPSSAASRTRQRLDGRTATARLVAEEGSAS